MQVGLVGALLNLLAQHSLNVVQDPLNIRFRVFIQRIRNDHRSVTVPIRYDTLNFLHGHQSLHEIAVRVEGIKLVLVGVQQVHGTGQRGRNHWPGQRLAHCIYEMALVIAHNHHRLLAARRKGGRELCRVVSLKTRVLTRLSLLG